MKNWQCLIISYNNSMRYILHLTLILFSLNAWSSPAEEPKEFSIPILDSAQALFGTQANFAANRLDSFFATERADDEFGRSRIRIRSRFDIRERAKSDLKNQYRINLRLPHLEQRFKYEYYQDKEEVEKKKKRELTEKEERQFLETNKLRTGWIFNSDLGVSAAIPPKLIARARVRNSYTTGTLIHRFAEQLTYITDSSGLVEETTIESDHVYSEDLIFRFVNYKQWEVLRKNFNTNHGPSWLYRISEHDALNYGFTMQTIIDNGVWYTTNYRLATTYRRNMYKQWVYLDVTPGLDFPKEWSFRRTPFISFQLELLFGT
jgi:hypothetical protein